MKEKEIEWVRKLHRDDDHQKRRHVAKIKPRAKLSEKREKEIEWKKDRDWVT